MIVLRIALHPTAKVQGALHEEFERKRSLVIVVVLNSGVAEAPTKLLMISIVYVHYLIISLLTVLLSPYIAWLDLLLIGC